MANEVESNIKANSIKNVHGHSAAEWARGKLALETKYFNVPLEDLRIWDSASNAVLPNTPATDDLGLDIGTFGTSGFTIQTNDFGGTSATQLARFRFTLPECYEAGGTVSLVFFCGALTTLPDTTLTIDADVRAKAEADGTHGSDLVTTSALDCRSLTLAAKSHTITPTGLTNGDELSAKITMAGVDSGDLGIMRGLITKIYWELQCRG